MTGGVVQGGVADDGALGGVTHGGGQDRAAVVVEQAAGAAAHDHGDEGVGGAEVDADVGHGGDLKIVRRRALGGQLTQEVVDVFEAGEALGHGAEVTLAALPAGEEVFEIGVKAGAEQGGGVAARRPG